MPRAVIVATGPNLDSLPDEVQDVANAFSAGGWTVRLCIHTDATQAGLRQAAAEGAAVDLRHLAAAVECRGEAKG